MGDAGFADEEVLGERELVHGPVAKGDEVEDVELGVGEAEGLEEGVAAALDGVMEGEEGHEKVVLGVDPASSLQDAIK